MWRKLLFSLVGAAGLSAGCTTGAPGEGGRPMYVVGAYCGEPCPWSPTGLYTDEASFGSIPEALSEARRWALDFGVGPLAVGIFLSSWEPGQSADVELPADGDPTRVLRLGLHSDLEPTPE